MAQRRTFRSLREGGRNHKSSVIGDAEAAFKSIGQTAQGEAIMEWLAMIVCQVESTENEGAWREHQARRKFAEEILSKMDGGPHGNRNPGQQSGSDDRREPGQGD